MKIRKTENHHMLLLPVLLILAAAFLATSLTGAFTSENDLTGNAVLNSAASGRCDWVGDADGPIKSTEVICPGNKSTVISGGCNIFDNQNGAISGSSKFSRAWNGTLQEGWTCTANKQVQYIEASAFCCNV